MSEDAPVDAVRADEWHGLHPASILVNLVPRAWRLLRGAWPFLLVLFVGGRQERGALFDVGLLVLFFLSSVASTVVHWATLRWRVAGGRLEIVQGLLQRQTRTIDPERIQDVELVRNVFHRMSGLVEVRVETASGKETEGLLSALDVPTAERLVRQLEDARRAARGTAAVTEEAPGDVLVETSVADVVRYGATSTGFGTVFLVLGLASQVLAWMTGEEDVASLIGEVGFVFVPLVLIGAWLVGIGLAGLTTWGFRLVRHERGLVAESGLLTRRRVEIRPGKVQSVTLEEPLLRRRLGFGSVRIETAAATSAGTEVSEATVPVVDVRDLVPLAADVLPGADVPELSPASSGAVVLATLVGALRGAVIATVLLPLAWPWSLFGYVLVPISVGAAWIDVRAQGFRVTDALVVARRGFWRRQTTLVPRSKVQSASVDQDPLIARQGLGRVVVRAAGTAVVLPLMPIDEARALLDVLGRLPGPARPPAPTGEPAQS